MDTTHFQVSGKLPCRGGNHKSPVALVYQRYASTHYDKELSKNQRNSHIMNTHMQRYSTSLVTGKMPMKTMMKAYYTFTRMAKLERLLTPSVDTDVGQQELIHCW